MNVNPAEKTMVIKVVGFIKADEAANYMKDYQDNINKINTQDYKLVIDGREQSAVASDVVGDMKEAIKMYMNSGFKKFAIVTPQSAVSRIQTKRATTEAGFTGSLVETLEEAYSL